MVVGLILAMVALGMLSDRHAGAGAATVYFGIAAASFLQGALLAGFGMLIELTESIDRNIARLGWIP